MTQNQPRKMVSFLSGPKAEHQVMFAGPQAPQEEVSGDPKGYAQVSVPSFTAETTLPPLRPVSSAMSAPVEKVLPSQK